MFNLAGEKINNFKKAAKKEERIPVSFLGLLR